MTDFKKIENYYRNFDEDKRLVNDNSGRLEYEMTMRKLEKYLPNEGVILDLGGGTGAYTFPLAEKGYKMYLADLSSDLIDIAKEKEHSNVISYDAVNATDLSIYRDNQFDVVLLFGPLYHLLEASERNACLKGINRVLKPNGLVFASFIPYLSGSIAIVDRYFKHPEQVNIDNLKEVFNSGKFNNASENGFQEGYYPTSDDVEEMFSDNGFIKEEISSVRGFGYGKEDSLYNIRDSAMFSEIINLIEKTSNNKEIVETCGHAIYIGKKH